MPFRAVHLPLAAFLLATAVDAASPAAAVAQRDGAVTLRLVSSRRVPTDDLAALGLTGANKPNGAASRLRMGVPDGLPPAIQRMDGARELFLADSTEDGWLALYRTPLAKLPPNHGNGEYRVTMFAPDGRTRWTLDLARFLSRLNRLEVQDVRYAGGKLYFNEACQSYSREAGGRCSALVRVDAARGTVDWRTPPLVSNNVFILHGRWVIAGYGFTAEPDYLRVVDRETGRVLARRLVDSAPTYLEMKDGRLHVLTYSNTHYVFEIVPARR
ncbi:MAG TPA: hypothetical protein VFQ39_17895 [Longimicrobium sp.]|nr:hypothetical protein [Longimicrobium sp.]